MAASAGGGAGVLQSLKEGTSIFIAASGGASAASGVLTTASSGACPSP